MKDLEIFHDAPDNASPEELAAYLDEACAGDPELRARVEALFAADRETFGLVDQVPRVLKAALERTDEDEGRCAQAGDVVGPYKLLQKIGEGGFGVVYMADQTRPVKRRVALKIIKQGMDTRQVIARFEAERQALAMMDHPNIAKVLDAGATESGRPYFAMELVRGIPITEFCHQQKFGPRRRLELFRDVCSAINHAHQKGIIHRDLKPSNVMVTLVADVPVVKVIDFGIAKATQSTLTDKTLFTRFEQFLGTPVYMSPEQAAMSAIDIDTRSDIYSLGVLLYELLAGAPPFDPKTLLSAGYDEMRRIIAEDEPPKPSTRLSQTRAAAGNGTRGTLVTTPGALRRDLDWIVMKAIEKDRTRRYETANAFSVDIERYLTDQPVVAAAPSVSYKFRKFARRNKTAFGVAAAMVILLLVGIATTTWQAVRATAEAERANAAETIAKQRMQEAERARQEAENARMKSDESRQEAEDISAFMVDMIQSAGPESANRERGKGLEMTVATVLEEAVRKLKTDLIGQPVRRANLQLVIGKLYISLGLFKEAVPLLEEAYMHQKREVGNQDQSLMPLQDALATAYSRVGEAEKAIPIREAHFELCRKFDGRLSYNASTSMYDLLTNYKQAGREKDAKELGKEYLRVCEDYAAKLTKELGPTKPWTMMARNRLARGYTESGRKEKALIRREGILDDCLEHLEPGDPNRTAARWYLADSYRDAGRMEEAVALIEENLEEIRIISGDEGKPTLSNMRRLARLYDEVGRVEEAIELAERCLAVRRRKVAPGHHGYKLVIEHLAGLYTRAGRIDDAIELREEILAERRRKRDPATHHLTIDAMMALEALYRESDRRADAEKLAKEAERLEEQALKAAKQREVEGRKQVAPNTTWLLKSSALRVWFGEDENYQAARKRAVEWAKDATESTDLERLAKLSCLQPVEDENLLTAVHAIARKALKVRTDERKPLAWFQMTLGMVEYRRGHYEESIGALTAAQGATDAVYRSEIVRGTAAFYHAMSLFQQGEDAEARALFEKAVGNTKPLPEDENAPFRDSGDYDDLILWLARKEAAALFGGSGGE